MRIGIDLGGTNTKIGMVNAKGELVEAESFSTRGLSAKEWIRQAVSVIRQWEEPEFIGIGVPGAADFKKGRIHYLPNLPGWEGVAITAPFVKAFGCPCSVENDATAMAWAEHLFGAARGYDNVLCITLGTGVGGGLILNGEIFRGSDGVAGEVGHMPLFPWGRQCSCSGKGCLERYVGNDALVELARKRKVLKKGETDLSRITAMAKEGNKSAQDFWREVAELLAPTMIGITNLLNIDAIVIGGGVAKAGKLVLQPLKEMIKAYAMKIQRKRVKVLKARLSNNAGMIGCAMLNVS